MANRKLGKFVAGAALGGASLLVFSPGIAFADGGQHGDDEGKVFAKPHVVRAGDKVKLLEVCAKPQEHAHVWSKITGKVELHEISKEYDGRGDEDWARHDGHGKGDEHQAEKGKSAHAKGEEHGKSDQGRHGGQGGGVLADGSSGFKDWGGYEHGQMPEEKTDFTGKDDDKSKHEDKSAHKDDSAHEDKGKHEDDSWEHKRHFVYYGEAHVSKDAQPGQYELNGSCGTGKLVVLPKGHVEGGDGGMTATGSDRDLATAGAGMLGASALGGIVLLLRRRANGFVA
jgi:hypothetical protein